MATLPDLQKGVFKDPDPPAVDSVLSPITIANGTTLITTKTTNETIDNVDQLIDYVSGDAGPNFIPQAAIDTLVSDLAARELTANKGAADGYAALDISQELLLANFPSGTALQVLRRNTANDALEFTDPTAFEVFTWTDNHSAGNFNLLDVTDIGSNTNPIKDIYLETGFLTSKIIFDGTEGSNDTFITGSGISGRINFVSNTLAPLTIDPLGIILALGSRIRFDNEDITIQDNGSDLQFDVDTFDEIQLRFGNVAEYIFSETDANFNFHNLINIESLIFGISTVFPPSTVALINYDGVAMTFNVPSPGEFFLTIGGSDEYQFTDIRLDMINNNIINLGTLNTHTIQGGTSTFALFSDNLSVFANTTSAQLAGIIDDETGSGVLVFNNTPTLLTPTIASFLNANHNHEDAAGGGTLLAAAISDFDASVSANSDVTANTAKITNATHTGDVTGATVLTIADNAVTLAKIQDIATASFIGRITAATGDPEVLTGTQATTLLDVFTDTLQGLVPASGGGTTNFLRADGTFAVPAGGGTGSIRLIKLEGIIISTDREGLNFADTSTINFTVTDDVANDEADVIASIVNDSVVDAQIGTHTSTKITITAKGQLNSAIVYNDQANTFGAFLQSFAASSMRIPLSATPVMAVDGDFAIDTLVTDFSHGIIKYFDGEELGVVSMPVAQFVTPTDGDVVAYNATNDEFELVTISGAGIISINGENGAAQTIAGTLNRISVVTTLNTQTLDVGSQVVLNNQANTYTGAGTQNFGAAGITNVNFFETTGVVASVGAIRFASTDAIISRNAADDDNIQLIQLTGTDIVAIGGANDSGVLINNFLQIGFVTAQSGDVRFANNSAVSWRNFANLADLGITFDANDAFSFAGSLEIFGSNIFTNHPTLPALDSAADTLLIRDATDGSINEVTPDNLGIGEVFLWTNNHDAGNFNLLNVNDIGTDPLPVHDIYMETGLGISHIFFDGTEGTNDTYITGSGISGRINFVSNTVVTFTVEDSGIIVNDRITFVDNDTTIQQFEDDLQFDVASTGLHELRFGNIPQYEFSATDADFNFNNLINVFIITPSIASFINAQHNHQDGAGGGQLLSTAALSDTDDIAYLNTANTYVGGGAQDFGGADLLDVTDIGDDINPVTDIYLTFGFNASHLYFDGGLGTNDTYFTGSGLSGLINIFSDGNLIAKFQPGGFELEDGLAWTFGGANLSIQNSGLDMQLDVILAGTFEFRFAGDPMYIFSQTELDVDGNNIINVNTLDAVIVSIGDSLIFPDDSTQEEAATRSGIDWELSTISFSGNAFDVTTEETQPSGVFFRADGLKMYISGSGSDSIQEYDLGTAWDVTTAVHLQTFPVALEDNQPQSVFFRSDGLKMYMTGIQTDDIHEYDLSTAWDISTAVILQFFSVSGDDNQPREIFFRSDGKKMYMVGTQMDNVNEYDLSTAWDVITAVLLQTFNVASEDNQPQGLYFRSDGLKMYMSGTQSSSVYEYNLSTPWDITTAVFTEIVFDVFDQNSQPQGLFFRSDGLRMYMTGANAGTVAEYRLGIAVPGILSVEDHIALDLTESAVDVSSFNESIIGITDNVVARTVTLSSVDALIRGKIIIIKDQAGTALTTNNITIDTEGSEDIDGAATAVIDTDFGSVRLYSNGVNWFSW